MTWATERRLDWIDDTLTRVGSINRSHITNYFGVTAVIASKDLGEFSKLDPHLIYDRERKQYERRGGGSVRGSTPERRAAWGLFCG